MFENQFVNESMLDVFLFETAQLIEKLEEIIVCNDQDCNYTESQINEIFRIMHTIKGSSSMMMYGNISLLAHTMEDLFYFLREESTAKVNYSDLSDLVLECIDYMKIEIEKLKNHDDPDGDFSIQIDKIKDFLSYLKNNGDMNINGNHIYTIRLFFEEGCEMENMRAFSIVHQIQDFCDSIVTIPEHPEDNSDCTEQIRNEGFLLTINTQESRDYIIQFLVSSDFVRDVDLIHSVSQEEKDNGKETSISSTVETISVESNSTISNDNQLVKGETKEKRVSNSIANQHSIISVSVTKLDKLMDLVGELVIAQAMVIQNSDLKGLMLNNFYKAARQLDKITDEMQDMVMSIRMVPLSATFHKMHRIVRDMSKKLGKEVNLQIIGEETEVDKNIIEHISDPLMHLVRNAIDHGLELPLEREVKGKERTGTLILEAKNSGGDVLILVKDDGIGLNKEMILDKARNHGLIHKPESEMTDKDIFNLVFLPGFSTNQEVTEYSGRGVGMDVVTKDIEKIGGSVSLDSKWNQETCVTLKIPLTLAIIDGMNIKVGDSHFTIPTVSVKEFFRPNRKDILIDPENHEFIMVRGECYPILRLNNFYNVKNSQENLEEGIIIMVEQDDSYICLFADELLGQQQVVVKALPEYIKKFNKIKSLTGCTLLGDGNISLILDISGLF